MTNTAEKDDLVERATRALLTRMRAISHGGSENINEVCRLGADEIERLRAQLASMRDALTACRTSYNGYAITKSEQYPEVLASFCRELRRIDDIARAALYTAPVSHTSVKDVGGEAVADMRRTAAELRANGDCSAAAQAIMWDKKADALEATASDAVADGAREKQASDAPIWMSATAAGAWADGYNACLEALPVTPVKAVGSEALREARNAGLEHAMEIVGNMRQSEAGLFDAKHSGQRGCDRSDALYDAYQAIRSALAHPGSGDAEPVAWREARQEVLDGWSKHESEAALATPQAPAQTSEKE